MPFVLWLFGGELFEPLSSVILHKITILISNAVKIEDPSLRGRRNRRQRTDCRIAITVVAVSMPVSVRMSI